METIGSKPSTLCNYEVMQILQNLKERPKKQKGQLATIIYETLRYLENTSCKYQNSSSIENCLKALDPFKLHRTEKLMLINTPPSTPLEIQLMIDEGEERLTQEQVDEILQIISSHFPQPEPTE